MARKAEEIKAEIESKLGFIPPFFEPAFETPDILENLWHQTLNAYLENPLPDLFKEKLAAMLGRYCTVPYCLICHSSSLRPLGMTASEVLTLLEVPPPSFDELNSETLFLGSQKIKGWPEAGSLLENAILACCVSIFLNQNFELCQKKLKFALEPFYYQHLNIFIAYNRTALSWAEMNPELSYERDGRAIDNLKPMLKAEPKLAEFFDNYQSRRHKQGSRQTKWLTNENRRLLDLERTRLNSYFTQAPVGFAVVEEPDHRFVMANAKFQEVTGLTDFDGKAIRSLLTGDQYSSFFDSLDRAYQSGSGFVELEKRIVHTDKFGKSFETFLDITAEPYRNEEGQISGLFIILSDVTLQVRGRASLRESQEYLRTTLMSIGDAVIATTAEAHPKIVFLNTVGEKLTGWTLAEAKGRPVNEVFDIINIKTRAPAVDPIKRVIREGQTVGLANHTALISRNGKEIIIEDSAAPIRDAKGDLSGVVLVFRDVTEKIILEEKSLLLNAVVESSKDFIGIARPDGKTFYVNPAGRAYLGLSAEVSTTKIIDYFAEEEKQRVTETLIPEVVRSGAWDGRVLFQNFSTGEKIPFSWNVFSVPDIETGGIAAIACVSKDLRESDRRQANSETEKIKLSKLLEQMPIGVCLLEGPKHRYSLINTRYYDLFGGFKDLLGKTVIEALPELEGSEVPRILDSVYSTGTPFYGNEYPIDLKDLSGHLRRLFLNFAYEPMRDANDSIYGISVTVIDVTELVAGRKVLEDNEVRLTLALNSGNIGTWEIDPRTGTLTWSNRGAAMYGFGDQLIISHQELLNRIYPDDRARVDAAIKNSMADEGTGVYGIEYRILLPDGEIRTIAAAGQTIYQSIDGKRKAVRFVGTVVDITDVTHTKEKILDAKKLAETANSAKSAFLANMSHEIRSPLGTIMGFAELIKNPDLAHRELTNYASVIERNSQHLLRIVDDILDLAKVEAGKMLIEHIDFSIHELLADFSSLMGFRARDKGIEFKLRVLTKLPSAINSDPTRIRQILTNIVGNAIKFTERGLVQLTVEFEDSMLKFEVSDTGPGIKKDQADKLFQAFHQGDVSTTRKFGGSGLGLVLTRRLSEALGGSFDLKRSVPDQGSIFISKVRVHIPPDALMIDSSNDVKFNESPKSSPEGSQKKMLNGMRILVVDDSPDNQQLFMLLLSKAGAITDVASNGSEGVNAALTNEYDVVLMDVQMPIMDGHQATQLLRSKGYTSPVVALTAHAMVEERARATQSGFTDFLSKPVHRDDLVQMLLKVKFET